MPSVYVMRDAVAPTERNCPDILFSAGTRSLGDIPSFGLLGGGQKVAGIVPTPLFVLLRPDIALEALKAMEPAWRMRHDTYNPALPSPPHRPHPPPPAPGDSL